MQLADTQSSALIRAPRLSVTRQDCSVSAVTDSVVVSRVNALPR
jgi:hypothetical protein